MKKALLTTSLFVSLHQVSTAQTFDYLDLNHIRAKINASGYLFLPNTAGDPSFEVPKNSGKNTILGSYIVIGGIESSSSMIHVVNGNNFLPGPLHPGTGLPGPSAPWNRVWKISAAEINYHIAHYTSSSYVPSPAIADWPGNGLSGAALAPFFDSNADGIYTPTAGDYPIIKGSQAIFTVFNDHKTGAGAGLKMGLEIHCMAYVMDCPGDSALYNTVFVNYEIINRSTTTYNNTYIALFTDTDLGDMMDDYLGSDVARGMFYTYNGDPMDDDVSFIQGYGSMLPAQGVTILAGPYQEDDGMDNPIETNYAAADAAGGIIYPGQGLNYEDLIVDNERIGMRHFHQYNFTPTDDDISTYNIVKGLKPDGSPFLHGTSSTPCSFDFEDNSDPLFWSTAGVTVSPVTEISLGNVPGDRRSVASMGPVSLHPGSYNQVDLAFTTAFDYTAPGIPFAGIPILQEYVDSIRSYYIAGATPCGNFIYNSVPATFMETNFSLYPNPTENILNVQVSDGTANNVYAIHDSAGKLVKNGTFNGTSASINIASLEQGIYYIQVNGTGAKKFVVQH